LLSPNRYSFEYSATQRNIIDEPTGLTWQRDASPDKFTWEAARDGCASLGNGARLPGLNELMTLVDFVATAPAIDTDFSDTPAERFWTASSLDGTMSAWAVDFKTGDPVIAQKQELGWVRCVRNESASSRFGS